MRFLKEKSAQYPSKTSTRAFTLHVSLEEQMLIHVSLHHPSAPRVNRHPCASDHRSLINRHIIGFSWRRLSQCRECHFTSSKLEEHVVWSCLTEVSDLDHEGDVRSTAFRWNFCVMKWIWKCIKCHNSCPHAQFFVFTCKVYCVLQVLMYLYCELS